MQDERIIGLFFARSEEAISALDLKYGKLCRQISGNILADPAEAEECVNDAYFGVWNAIPPQRPKQLGSFVLRIVRNLSLKRYRRNRARKRDSSHDATYEELQSCLASSQTVEQALEAKELTNTLEQFLDTLSRENRVIFLRRYWFSDSYETIAALTGLSEKTVSVRLVRTREKLRKFLTEQGVLV